MFLVLSTRECGSRGLRWWQGTPVAHLSQRRMWGSSTWALASDCYLTCRVVPDFLRLKLPCVVDCYSWECFLWSQVCHVPWKEVWVLLSGHPAVKSLDFLSFFDHWFFPPFGVPCVLPCVTPNKRVLFFECLPGICTWAINTMLPNKGIMLSWEDESLTVRNESFTYEYREVRRRRSSWTQPRSECLCAVYQSSLNS